MTGTGYVEDGQFKREPSGEELVATAAARKAKKIGMTVEQIDKELYDLSLLRLMGKVRGEDRPVTSRENTLLDMRLWLTQPVA